MGQHTAFIGRRKSFLHLDCKRHYLRFRPDRAKALEDPVLAETKSQIQYGTSGPQNAE
jgi:hypothetical protein